MREIRADSKNQAANNSQAMQSNHSTKDSSTVNYSDSQQPDSYASKQKNQGKYPVQRKVGPPPSSTDASPTYLHNNYQSYSQLANVDSLSDRETCSPSKEHYYKSGGDGLSSHHYY
jgi:formamidopyrimidine-DNA glycosylase